MPQVDNNKGRLSLAVSNKFLITILVWSIMLDAFISQWQRYNWRVELIEVSGAYTIYIVKYSLESNIYTYIISRGLQKKESISRI